MHSLIPSKENLRAGLFAYLLCTKMGEELWAVLVCPFKVASLFSKPKGLANAGPHQFPEVDVLGASLSGNSHKSWDARY